MSGYVFTSSGLIHLFFDMEHQIVGQLGDRAVIVSDLAHLDRLYEAFAQQARRIDVLFANAGELSIPGAGRQAATLRSRSAR